MIPVIFGLSGPVLTPDERAFFAEADPLGFILFAHNVVDRAQLRALTDDLRALSGRDDLPILIDQEGGPVARLTPPEWPAFPAGPAFDHLYRIAPMSAIQAMRANAAALGATLAEVGITVDCGPMLDVAQVDTTDAIACRAFGAEPMQVAAIGRAMLEGLATGGVAGVVKHMPGHGRARSDSHVELPVVGADAAALEADIRPFHTLAHAPIGMTAHVVYEAWDDTRPVTLSPTVIAEVIRGAIGFDGLLLTDDIAMKALSGTAVETATAALAAGCDVVLDCWSRGAAMADVAGAVGTVRPESLARLERATAYVAAARVDVDVAEMLAKRDAFLALA